MAIFKLSKKPNFDWDVDVFNQNKEIRENEDEEAIILDGPISKIYTEALNAAYANESYMTDGSTENEDLASNNVYVYTIDAGELELKDANEGVKKLSIALDSKKYRNILLAVENVNKIKNPFILLEAYAASNDISVCYSKESLMSKLL